MMNIIRQCRYVGQYLRCTRGVAAMEYAIIVGVVVVGVGAAAVTFQGQIETFIENMTTRLTGTTTNIETVTFAGGAPDD